MLAPHTGADLLVLGQIGEIAETADNYWHLGKVLTNPMQAQQALRVGMEDIARRLKALYGTLSDTDPWEHQPCQHCRGTAQQE